MPSIVTGIIGGWQSRNAATNAEKAQVAAATQAGQTVQAGTTEANALVGTAGATASERALAAGTEAAASVTTAGTNAAAGVTDAAATGVGRIDGAVGVANGYLNPYISAGGEAVSSLSQLANGPGFKFGEDDPSYQWRMQQGLKAIERSAARRGGLGSAGTLKALTRFGSGLASTEYGAAFNRFQQDRNSRTSALSTLAGFGLNASGKASDNVTGAARDGAQLTYGAARDAGGFETAAARDAGGFNTRAAEFAGNADMWSAGTQSRNTMANAEYQGNMQLGVGDARASAHVGRANAWNGMLQGIGAGANSMIAGGYSGGGGFKMRDMFRPAGTTRRSFNYGSAGAPPVDGIYG